MSRRIQVYVSSDIFAPCRLIAESRSDEMHKVTVEDVIEGFVKDAIDTEYPTIREYQKAVDKLKRELIKSL